MLTTTLQDAILDLEISDLLAIREEIALGDLDSAAIVTDTTDEPMTIIGAHGKPLTVAQALDLLDERVGDLERTRP